MTTPEAHIIGLHQDPHTMQWQFTMPQLQGSKSAEATKSFVIETLVAVLRAERKLPKAAMTVQFVGSMAGQHVAAAAASVVISQLYDTALTQMLNAIGDVHLQAAMRELRHAIDEPTTEGKKYHRAQADTHVGAAYEAVAIELNRLKASWLPRPGKTSACLAHAAYLALIKAYISRDAGLAVTPKWVALARAHYGEYDEREAKGLRQSVAETERLLAKYEAKTSIIVNHPYQRSMQVRVFDPAFRTTAIHDIEERLAEYKTKLAPFDRDLPRFREICETLK